MATFFERIANTLRSGDDEVRPTRDLGDWLESTLKDELNEHGLLDR
jgi:hypothetical protein